VRSILIAGAALTFSRPTASTNRALSIAHGFAANGYAPAFFDLRGDRGVAIFGGIRVVEPRDEALRDVSGCSVSALTGHLAAHRYDVLFLLSSPAAVIQALTATRRSSVVVYDLVEDPLGSLFNLPWRPYSPSFWRQLAVGVRDTWAWYRGGWPGPDLVTVVSANLGRIARHVVSERATIYLPILSSASSRRAPADASSPLDRRTITHCGGLSSAKDGISTLLDAMALLRSRRVPIRLDMFGHGLRSERMRLEVALRSRRLRDVVTWRGFVAPDELERRLARSAALVLCKSDSRQNRFNFATRLIDYLSAARPCIVSRVGETDRFFRHGDNALLFEAGDHRTLAHHIEWVLHHPRESDEIGRRGHQLLEAAFDARRRIATMLAAIEERAGSSAGGELQLVDA
jgi:glycosyltransferase involved in cell wall biosynthesis